MRKRSQAEAIRNMPDRALILNLYFTQLLLAVAAFVIGWFLFGSWGSFFRLFQWRPVPIFLLGGGLAAFVILLDMILMKELPEGLYDDGGINERLFSILSVPHAFFVTVVIAFVEEGLFRGVLQAHFGLIIASLIFAVLHIRYLRKTVLFIVTVALSFLLGLLFWYTQNLLVCMFAHFVIDFVQGAAIRIKHKRFHHVQEEAEWMAPLEENNEVYEETGEDHASLPSRKEYHGRKTKRKKGKSPFLLARVLLAAFIILVVAALVFSISNYHFS